MFVDERRSKLKSSPTEDLGWYNPHTKKAEINSERVKYWISVGAKPSATVHNLLVANKIIEGKKIAKHKVGIPKEAQEKTADPQAAAQPEAAQPAEKEEPKAEAQSSEVKAQT